MTTQPPKTPDSPQSPRRQVRLSDIAEALGLSTATVSRALSGRGYVRSDVARRVHAMARDMGYRTGIAPAPAIGGRVLLAASREAMVDFQRSQFTLHVLEGLKARAEVLGLELEHRLIASELDKRSLGEEARSAGDVVGVLLLTIDDDLLDLARWLKLPVVLVNSDDPDMRLSSVTPCNRSAAALATQHLRALGHERILFLTRPGRRTIQRRMEGWRDHMARGCDELVVEVTDWTPELAHTAITTRIAANEGKADFTAVLAAGDALAAGAISALVDAGLKVPEDVSVVGIDGLPQSALLNPALTTVEIPMEAVGAAALDLLCDCADASASAPARRIELACSLVVRQSSAGVLR